MRLPTAFFVEDNIIRYRRRSWQFRERFDTWIAVLNLSKFGSSHALPVRGNSIQDL